MESRNCLYRFPLGNRILCRLGKSFRIDSQPRGNGGGRPAFTVQGHRGRCWGAICAGIVKRAVHLCVWCGSDSWPSSSAALIGWLSMSLFLKPGNRHCVYRVLTYERLLGLQDQHTGFGAHACDGRLRQADLKFKASLGCSRSSLPASRTWK